MIKKISTKIQDALCGAIDWVIGGLRKVQSFIRWVF